MPFSCRLAPETAKVPRLAVICWFLALTIGQSAMLTYGWQRDVPQGAGPPVRWPEGTRLAQPERRFTLAVRPSPLPVHAGNNRRAGKATRFLPKHRSARPVGALGRGGDTTRRTQGVDFYQFDRAQLAAAEGQAEFGLRWSRSLAICGPGEWNRDAVFRRRPFALFRRRHRGPRPRGYQRRHCDAGSAVER